MVFSEIKVSASYKRIDVTPSARGFHIRRSLTARPPFRAVELFCGGGTLSFNPALTNREVEAALNRRFTKVTPIVGGWWSANWPDEEPYPGDAQRSSLFNRMPVHLPEEIERRVGLAAAHGG